VFATFVSVAAPTFGAGTLGGGESCQPNMILFNLQVVAMCFNLVLADFGMMPPSALKMLPATSKIWSYSDRSGI